MSNAAGRFARRLAERQAARLEENEPRQADRRQAERRTEELTGPQLEARLRELGVEDRRRGHRRGSGDRRRR